MLPTLGSCGCLTLGGAQDQSGWASEHPDLAEGVPAHSRGLELDDHQSPLLTQATL